ncbi:hypothetical protein QA640_32575 [Bradyrhizobium sp. CB82]|uniref:hypothetical protein n=1 Tax=Bradyrhizobium sp. CB82 TaxID=3039159 RepID=UPI0024B17933|nr:hypothetical protein [Bradyrhizobium sp. CB82]WFU39091.1 hypothetical protein QA640_32575 [Bradyrhizobium sp. CB82]
MSLLVTSAAGAGYGNILAFADNGELVGTFGDDPRIVDPRGLGIDPVDRLLFINSGSNRILALDRNGKVVRATGSVEGLNPGGGNLGPDGRYHVGLRSERTIMAYARQLDRPGEYFLPPHIVPFSRGFAFGADGALFLASGSEHPFGVANAVTTVREYDRADGRLVRVLLPNDGVRFQKPRGLRFGPHGQLYCVA